MKTTIKLIVVVAIATSFSNFSILYAQESKIQTVLISATMTGGYLKQYQVEVVKPDYSVEINEYSSKDNPNVELKRELDKWIEQGYEIKESTSRSFLPNSNVVSILYILVKEN